MTNITAISYNNMKKFKIQLNFSYQLFQNNDEALNCRTRVLVKQNAAVSLDTTNKAHPQRIDGSLCYMTRKFPDSCTEVQSQGTPSQVPSPIRIPNWHRVYQYPWPVPLQPEIIQECADFTRIMGRTLCSGLLEQTLRRQACPRRAGRPNEYLKSFTILGTHGECAGRSSAPDHPLRSPKQDCSLQRQLPQSFHSPQLPEGQGDEYLIMHSEPVRSSRIWGKHNFEQV